VDNDVVDGEDGQDDDGDENPPDTVSTFSLVASNTRDDYYLRICLKSKRRRLTFIRGAALKESSVMIVTWGGSLCLPARGARPRLARHVAQPRCFLHRSLQAMLYHPTDFPGVFFLSLCSCREAGL